MSTAAVFSAKYGCTKYLIFRRKGGRRRR